EKIKKQSEDLREAEKLRHEQELTLKQRDMEMLLVNANARDQLTANLSGQLKEVAKSDDVRKGLQGVINELNAQNESINKQALINQNLDEINTEFYARLLDQFPDLTKVERELCGFLKLSLSNKEIATLKNSTENSVNVSKARLRKKLGLTTNKELSKFLLEF
ncbi:MAG: hypothetical protein AAF391_14050, partial [Bacteroidota bacterium]